MPQRGGRPLRRGVFSFEAADWAPPKSLVLDTSIAVEAALASQSHHAACARLLERLAEAETRVLLSDMVVPEFAEAVYKIVLKERHGDWRRFWRDGRIRRRADRLLDSARRDWEDMRNALIWNSVPLVEASRWIETLMARYGLHSYDAAHAGSALAAGAEDLATLDRGFGRVSEGILTLHTATARVAYMRRLRPRRKPA